MIAEIKERFKTNPNAAMRELVRGLMKGNREEMKLGYTPANAVIAAQDLLGLDARQAFLLLAYAKGFHDCIRGATGESRFAAIEERPEYAEVGLNTMEVGDAYDAGTAAVDVTLIDTYLPAEGV